MGVGGSGYCLDSRFRFIKTSYIHFSRYNNLISVTHFNYITVARVHKQVVDIKTEPDHLVHIYIIYIIENYQAMLWIKIAQFHSHEYGFLPRYHLRGLDHSRGSYLLTTTNKKKDSHIS